MNKFNLKITDLETGETIVDANVGAIVGAYHKEEDGDNARGFSLSHGTLLQFAGVCKGAQDVVSTLLDGDPTLRLAYACINSVVVKADTEGQEGEDDE